MTTLLATSVVRGARQGESHGGVYLIDLDRQRVAQTLDWNKMDIEWEGRGWDRGLRGIAFDGDKVCIAASDELFFYTPGFEKIASHRNPYLKHCHEIFRYQRRLYLTSTGFDSLLGFDLDKGRFSWGLRLSYDGAAFSGAPFDPNSSRGPLPGNQLHLNTVFCNSKGMFLSGLRTGGVLIFNGRKISRWASLPQGTHNAQPYREGVLFNDTQADLVRYVSPTTQWAFPVPRYDEDELTHTDLDDTRIARQAFGRGLCPLEGGLIAAGSSPSTVALHDLDAGKTLQRVTLSYDIRNAIHGLEAWPWDFID